MAYAREVTLDIGTAGIGLRISGLDISFNINRSIEFASNTAQFIIYNAKEETRNGILKVGNNIICKAGYKDEGGANTIFIGTITTSQTRKEKSNWITEIEANDISGNKTGLKYTTVKVSYKANTPTIQLVSDIAALLNVAIAGINNVTSVLNNGETYSGSVGGLLKRLRKILRKDNLGLYFDQSEMVIYKLGGKDSTFGIVRVTSTSGLINKVQKIDDEDAQDQKKRVSFRSLLNWKIRPNSVINLDANVKGTYIVEKVNFLGNNFGGDFFADVEAVE